MSPVPWTTLDPNVCEDMIAIMMCRENPDIVRIRPSQGDGGIDLIRVTEAGWVVDQIKYFPLNLTSGQKTQIAKSFAEVRKFASSKGARIAEWRLVVPLDPTKENYLDWFDDELTKGAEFPCAWRGLSYLEGLAGTYPEVVDYYVGNGKARVEELIAQMVTGFRLVKQSAEVAHSGQLQPLDTVDGLRAIYAALNANDPLYRYSFAVDHAMPALPPDEPHLVAATQIETETAWVTFKIYARFDDAVNVRPISINLTVTASQDSETAQAMQDFGKFGSPVSVTSGEGVELNVSLDLPGGLGGVHTSGTAIIGLPQATDITSSDLRMQVLDPASQELATARIKFGQATAGFAGEGMRRVGTEEHGVFKIDVRMDLTEQTSSFTLSGGEVAGLRPAEALPGLRVVAAFRAPNLLRFALPYGPITHAGVPLSGGDPESGLWLEGLVKLVEALAIIQEHTAVQITVPALAQLTDEIGNELIGIAHILETQQEESTWTGFACDLPAHTIDPEPDYEASAPCTIDRPLVARVGDLQVPLGEVRYRFASARLASTTPLPDGRVRVKLVPGTDTSVSVQHIPATAS